MHYYMNGPARQFPIALFHISIQRWADFCNVSCFFHHLFSELMKPELYLTFRRVFSTTKWGTHRKRSRIVVVFFFYYFYFSLFLLSLADGPAVEAGGSGGEHLNKKPKLMMMKMANKTPSSTFLSFFGVQ